MFYQNVRGLRSKLDVCKNSILSEQYDVYALTETFLNSSVCDSELFPNDYVVLRKDRCNDSGWGGVLLAIRNCYDIKNICIKNYLSSCTDCLEITVATVKRIEDCQALQNDINSVCEWSKMNRLDLNEAKCKVMTFTRSKSPHLYGYKVSDRIVARENSIRDLGVLFDRTLSFNDHIIDLCQNAYKALGFIFRQTARFNDKTVIISLYYAFVRSKLEYNTIVWSPHEKNYKLMIEKIQRKFSRCLFQKMYGYYPYLYPSLYVTGMVGMDTLELRRERALMVHYYLLLNNKIDNPVALGACGVWAPSCSVQWRSRPLFAESLLRTRAAWSAPTHHALNLLNKFLRAKSEVDLFNVNIVSFVSNCTLFLSQTF
ncbi:uncharacterized protein LOC123700669 [Colias croceus]|uniref:uncharacterized protein LOC123700669 n=1 Tax=Colias crocea TaxID=72248 RepID=UPI001E27A8C7|nr:uncharacterized protein LOC123700669 [Colias croceus]